MDDVLDTTDDEREFRDRASLQAELQEIARAKAPEHAVQRGFWAKVRRKD
jgi:hypothetical protein